MVKQSKVTQKQIEKELKAICKYFGVELVSIEWFNDEVYHRGEFLVCVEENTTISAIIPKFQKNRSITLFEVKKHLWGGLDYVLGKAEDVIVTLAK